MTIYSTNETQEFYFREGCHILELLNSNDHAECSIARARVEPNQQTHFHKLLATTERYLILSGNGTVTVGTQTSNVASNDVVVIPAGVRQSIRNTGKEDLVFLAICTPRFKEENYEFCD